MVPKWLLHKHIATIKKNSDTSSNIIKHHQTSSNIIKHQTTSSNILISYIYIHIVYIYIPPYPHYIPLVIYQTSSIGLRAAWCRAVLSVSSTAFTSISLDLLSKYSTTWKKRGWKILQEWRSIAGKIMENHRTKWGRKKIGKSRNKMKVYIWEIQRTNGLSSICYAWLPEGIQKCGKAWYNIEDFVGIGNHLDVIFGCDWKLGGYLCPRTRMQSRRTLFWNKLFEHFFTCFPVTVPVHCRLCKTEECGVQSVGCEESAVLSGECICIVWSGYCV